MQGCYGVLRVVAAVKRWLLGSCSLLQSPHQGVLISHRIPIVDLVKLFLVSSFIFLTQGIYAQTFKHGLLLGGGTGSLSGVSYRATNPVNEDYKFVSGSSNYKFNATAGYKFRYSPSDSRLFYDVDLQAGLRIANLNVHYLNTMNESVMDGVIHINDFIFCNASLGLTANFKITKNLYAGAGLEPIWRFYELGEYSDQPFDMTLVAKLGYELKYFDIAIVCKKGMFNVMESDRIEKGKLNDLQLQLFIPF
jgi:hypothetical protein